MDTREHRDNDEVERIGIEIQNLKRRRPVISKDKKIDA